MKKICIVSGSRAEFGLLYPLIVEINKSNMFALDFIVTGSHLDNKYGKTINEINNSKITINKEIKLPLNIKDNSDMAEVISFSINKFTNYFKTKRPDLLIVLGDRYEIFGVSIAASMLNIPIAHIAGGETTEGAVDEFIRHSITKMSYFHFASAGEYRNRIIQLGEDPKRVFNVGSLSADNIKNEKLIPINDLEKEFNIDLHNTKYGIVTYHPETLNTSSIKKSMKELIKALEKRKDMNYIITKSNADTGGELINSIWDKEAKKHSNWRVEASLGFKKYLSLLKHSQMMIGNSSSGFTEAPIMKVPTINIGDRQKGRLQTLSILNCQPECNSIVKAMEKAENKSFISKIQKQKCPYGNGKTASKIVKILEKELFNKDINLKKKFYDIKK